MAEQGDNAATGDRSGIRLAATGSIAGAILASSCCIVPLVLVTLGVSGAWIGSLTTLEPYKPIFIVITTIFLGYGFRHVYGKPKNSCGDDAGCATETSNRVTKSALWVASVLVLLALTIDYWAHFFY